MDFFAPISMGEPIGVVDRVSAGAQPAQFVDNRACFSTAQPAFPPQALINSGADSVRAGQVLLSPDAILALSPSSQTNDPTGRPNSEENARENARENTGRLKQKADETPDKETDARGLTKEEQAIVQALQKRDAEVRSHEQAHAAVGGSYASAPTYTTQRGPDGKLYAIGGEVMIDASPIPNDPEATIAKMQIVARAALAPANPSSQDLSVAAQANQTIAVASNEIARRNAGLDPAAEPRIDTPQELGPQNLDPQGPNNTARQDNTTRQDNIAKQSDFPSYLSEVISKSISGSIIDQFS